MLYLSTSRTRSQVARRREMIRLSLEILEGRTQPGGVLPFNEFSLVGADLFERDPLTHELSTSEDLALSSLVSVLPADPVQAVSFGAGASEQSAPVSQPAATPVQTESTSAQPLWQIANATSAAVQPTQGVEGVPVPVEAHTPELTRIVPDPFRPDNIPILPTASPTVTAISYAAFDNSEANAVAANIYTGESYVGGSIGYEGDRQAFITKYDATGMPVWTAIFQGQDPELAYSDSTITGLAVDPYLGVFYAVGTAREAEFGDTDLFIMQLFDNGAGVDTVWGYGLGDVNDDQGGGVSVDYNTNNVYFTGTFSPAAGESHVIVFGLDYSATAPLFAVYYTFGADFIGSAGRGAAFDGYSGNAIAVGSLTQASDGQTVAMAMGLSGIDGAGVGALYFANPDGSFGEGTFHSAAFDYTDGGVLVAGTLPTDTGGTAGISAKLSPDFQSAYWAWLFGGTKGFRGIDTDNYGYAYIVGTVDSELGDEDVLIGQFDAYTGEPIPDQVGTLGGAGNDTGRAIAISYDLELWLPITNLAFTTTTEDLPTSDGSVYPAGAASVAAYAAVNGWL